jgi:hypothetical protein
VRRLILWLFLFGLAPLSWGQYSVWTQPFVNQQGQPLVGASIAVCTSQPTFVVPCGGSSEATVYSGFSGTSVPQPLFTDSNGLAPIFATSGNYYIQVYGVVNGIPIQTLILPITVGGTGGGGGGAVSSVFGRTGAVVANSMDYGTTGIFQTTGSSASLAFMCNLTGTCQFGSNATYLQVPPQITANGNTLNMVDNLCNEFGFNNSSGAGLGDYVEMGTGPCSAGTNYYAAYLLAGGLTAGSGYFQWLINGTSVAQWNTTASTFNVPANFAGTGGFQIGGSFGLNGQVPCSTGSAVAWSSTCGANTGIGSIGLTANQLFNTGTTSAPVLALYGGPNGGSSPLIFPGNLQGTQYANGNDFFTVSRATDTSPTGTFWKLKTAGGTVIGQIDVSANFLGNSFTSLGGNAGYYGYAQGGDNIPTCLTAITTQFGVNGTCDEAPATITAPYGVIKAGTAPAAASVKTYTTASGSPLETTESFTPVTGTSAHVQTGDGTVAACGSGVIATYDGSGDTHCSGTNITNISPSLMGPGSAYTNSTTSATTVFSYTSTIPASATVMVTCVGTYSFTTAAEAAEFGLNFSSAPTTMRVNVYIGINATTGTNTFGLQTTNGALITASSSAAATGTQFPVRIEGGVTTNGATTFTVQGATSSASGTLNVAANGFTCTVK